MILAAAHSSGVAIGVGLAVVLGMLLLFLVAAMFALAVAIRRRGGGPGSIGRPDSVSADVVSGLLAELEKERAETAYWKSAAERLQRELDARPPAG